MFQKILSGLKDLIQVLPTHSRSEWTSLSSLDPAKPIVVLVSGFGATSRNLTVVRKRLIRDGFNVLVLALDWHELSDSIRGLYRMAEKLSSLILAVRKNAVFRKTPIFLVAHSAGGLVARYYVQQLGGSHYVEGLITLATPHQGTWYAGLGLLTHLILKARVLIQMLPVSPFIQQLNLAHFPPDFPMTNVYSNADMLCPVKSTLLPPRVQSEGMVESIQMSEQSHGSFLISKRVYETVHTRLTAMQTHSTGAGFLPSAATRS